MIYNAYTKCSAKMIVDTYNVLTMHSSVSTLCYIYRALCHRSRAHHTLWQKSTNNLIALHLREDDWSTSRLVPEVHHTLYSRSTHKRSRDKVVSRHAFRSGSILSLTTLLFIGHVPTVVVSVADTAVVYTPDISTPVATNTACCNTLQPQTQSATLSPTQLHATVPWRPQLRLTVNEQDGHTWGALSVSCDH